MEFLDNVGRNRLGDALAKSIDECAKLSIISSYFTVFAFSELKEELEKVDSVRFLFSEPTFVKRMASDKDPRQFAISQCSRERGVGGLGLELTLRNNLNQRAIARECAEWVRAKCEFQSAKMNGAIQPGGTYIVENPNGDDHAFMGAAADFTQEGLGYERRPNTVMGVSHYKGATETAGLKAMFESVWDKPAMVADVTDEVAAQVGTLYRENPPEFVYFLTLYHLFRDYLSDEDNDLRPGLKFEESVVWNKLYDFQKDAVVGAIRKLEKYKGCIIADSVGLGKTYERSPSLSTTRNAMIAFWYWHLNACAITGRCGRRTTMTATRWRMIVLTTPCSITPICPVIRARAVMWTWSIYAGPTMTCW